MDDIFKIKGFMKRLCRAAVLFGAVSLLTVQTGCRDDLDFGGMAVGEGTASVSLSVSFNPPTLSEVSTRTSGEAFKEFSDVWVFVFDRDGTFKDKFYFEKDDFLSYKTDEPTDSVWYTAMAHAALPAITLPYGTYHIYSIGNMGGNFYNTLTTGNESFNENSLRNYKLTWDADDVTNNKQMTGYFEVVAGGNAKSGKTTASTNYGEKHVCTIVEPKVYLHSWMRRNATKVTVAYDASNMRENITVYLKSVKICDGAKYNTLVKNYTVGSNDDLLQADIINYSDEESENHDKWPSVSKGNPSYGSHEITADALYCFENLQDTGDDTKVQTPTTDNPEALTQEEKDNMPYGTYVEVEGYYVSNASGSEGKGKILYRFMLGKDATTNFDVERNYHLMLTLCFTGNANDVDWHIAYEEESKPGVYLPEKNYISYLYNQQMEYPIRIELSEGDEIANNYIEAQITVNDWRPVDESDNPAEDNVTKAEPIDDVFEYYTGNVSFDGVWNGFLSLYQDKRTIFNNSGQECKKGNWNQLDWYGLNRGNSSYGDGSGTSDNIDVEVYEDHKPTIKKYTGDTESGGTEMQANWDQGYRRYNVPTGNGTYYFKKWTENYDGGESTDGGSVNDYRYRVVRSGNRVTVYIPMYTRPLVMTTQTGYSGNNPFVSYKRKARVKITVNGTEATGTIYQVERQINPKGVYRSHDNVRPFTVMLMTRSSEDKFSDFYAYTSDGPWKAEITTGSGWTIIGRSSGSTGSNISITVAPVGKINQTENKCAILDISYNNYTCNHKVILRQGDAPMQMVQNGCKWHSYNLWYNTTGGAIEVKSPLDEGSMFFYTTYDNPIDAINNTHADFNQYCPYNSTGTEITYKDRYYICAPLTPGQAATTKQWKEYLGSTSGSFSDVTIDGTSCQVASVNDFAALRDGADLGVGYGICYGNNASTTQYELNRVYRSAWYKRSNVDASSQSYYGRGVWESATKTGEWNSDPNGVNGMRGCFVYDKTNANNIFFPIGQSGYGHRMHSSEDLNDGYGHLRYAGRGERMSASDSPQTRPMFYAIYFNLGAIYWVKTGETDLGSEKKRTTAWDFNYSTYDFNGYNTDATDKPYYSACYIRLVEKP